MFAAVLPNSPANSAAGGVVAAQVDLGLLGQVPSDLEHSIMLRQRSLSSRTSLEETGVEQQRLLGA